MSCAAFTASMAGQRPKIEDAVTRPVLRWHGGKWMLAPWIVAHFPRHRVYVEPFGGAASVLMRKNRSYAEVLNDLDASLVNLFRVLRDPMRVHCLRRRLELTPFARDEWLLAYEPSTDPVEEAARLVVRCFMGFGNDGARRDVCTGFRGSVSRRGSIPARDWVGYPAALDAAAARLQGVIIEHRDAVACMAYYDAPDVLHYVDPPYHPETRTRAVGSRGYTHDMSAEDHARLLAELGTLSGMVILSGYPHASYEASLRGWRRVERPALADGARHRTEVLWINAAASEALSRTARDLFTA